MCGHGAGVAIKTQAGKKRDQNIQGKSKNLPEYEAKKSQHFEPPPAWGEGTKKKKVLMLP